jgi:hypothetical protein
MWGCYWVPHTRLYKRVFGHSCPFYVTLVVHNYVLPPLITHLWFFQLRTNFISPVVVLRTNTCVTALIRWYRRKENWRREIAIHRVKVPTKQPLLPTIASKVFCVCVCVVASRARFYDTKKTSVRMTKKRHDEKELARTGKLD